MDTFLTSEVLDVRNYKYLSVWRGKIRLHGFGLKV